MLKWKKWLKRLSGLDRDIAALREELSELKRATGAEQQAAAARAGDELNSLGGRLDALARELALIAADARRREGTWAVLGGAVARLERRLELHAGEAATTATALLERIEATRRLAALPPASGQG